MDKLELQIRIAKDQAISIPDEKERAKAFKWIKKIENNTTKSLEKTKAHILNLLTICLQRKMLVGPFQNPPQPKKTLTQLRVILQPEDIAKLIIEKEIEKSDRPPVSVEINGDLCEYVAYQDIPYFGAHFFYAFSPELIKNWTNVDASIIPRGLLTLTSISTPDTSILAKNLKDTVVTKEKDLIDFGDSPPQKTAELKDVSVLQVDGQLRKEFLGAEPIAKDLNLDLLQGAITRNMLKKDQISGEQEFRSTTLEGPHIAKVQIKTKGKSSSRTDERNVLPQHKSLMENVEGQLNWVESREEYDARCRQEMVEKMPPKLQARMKEHEATKAAAMQKAIEKAEKHKMEMAQKQEEADKLLKYRFKPKKTKCLQQKRLKKASKQESKLEIVEEAPTKERNLLYRLENLKRNQPKRLVFDDVDKQVLTEDDKFEMFIDQELQGGNRQRQVGDERVLEDLGQTEMLLNNAMLKSGRFKEDDIEPSDTVYKEVTLADAECEGDKIKPKQGGLVYGKRRVEMPGFEPMEQIFIEEINLPDSITQPIPYPGKISGPLIYFDESSPSPASETNIDKVLDETLKNMEPGDRAPRLYGQWAGEQEIGMELQGDEDVYPTESQEAFMDRFQPRQNDHCAEIMESVQDKRELQNLEAASHIGLELGSIELLQNTIQSLPPNDCDNILDKTLKSLVHARNLKDIQEATRNVAVLLGEEVDGENSSLDYNRICDRLTKIRGNAFNVTKAHVAEQPLQIDSVLDIGDCLSVTSDKMSPTQENIKKSVKGVVDFYDLIKDFDPLYGSEANQQEEPSKLPCDVLTELSKFYGVNCDLSQGLNCLEQGTLRRDGKVSTARAKVKTPRANEYSPGANRQSPAKSPIGPREMIDNDVSGEVTILEDDVLDDNFGARPVQSPVPVAFMPMPCREPIVTPQTPDIYNLEGPINTSSEQILIARAKGQTDRYQQLKTTFEIKKGRKNKNTPSKSQPLPKVVDPNAKFGELPPVNEIELRLPTGKSELPESNLKLIKRIGEGKEVLIKKSSISRPIPKPPRIIVTPATEVTISNRTETHPVERNQYHPKLGTMQCVVSSKGKTVSTAALLGVNKDTHGRKSVTKKQIREAHLPERYEKNEYKITVRDTSTPKSNAKHHQK